MRKFQVHTRKATALRPIIKSMATTLRRNGQPLRRECWEATTADGLWAFERIDDVGTPWIVVYKPRTPEFETCSGLFGTLKSARTAVELGWVKPPSEYRSDHAAGLHENNRGLPCPDCESFRRGQHS